ncbi:MAG: hypothetical protein WCK34_18675 [Bacteroidota bacterium]
MKKLLDLTGTWTEFQKLYPAGMDTIRNHFGKSFAIRGNYAAACAPGEKVNDSACGVFCIFKYNGEKWARDTMFQARSLAPGYFEFARSVSKNGNTIAVGSTTSVYIYALSNGHWVFQTLVNHKYSNHGFGYYGYGSSVWCSYHSLLAGANDDSDMGSMS